MESTHFVQGPIIRHRNQKTNAGSLTAESGLTVFPDMSPGQVEKALHTSLVPILFRPCHHPHHALRSSLNLATMHYYFYLYIQYTWILICTSPFESSLPIPLASTQAERTSYSPVVGHLRGLARRGQAERSRTQMRSVCVIIS